MTVYVRDADFTLHHGDVLDVLPTLPDASVNCCVTSPPYWGLRDYGADGQLGLEPTPDEYVARMVDVFREVRRVLRDDGTLWLNLGDSYASSPKGNPEALSPGLTNMGRNTQTANKHRTRSTVVGDLKPKDLVGIPWRVAFALQQDGWYLRSDIIWSKPNPMPESVTDRPTKAHEYVFLLTKSSRYFFDQEAVREKYQDGDQRPPHGPGQASVNGRPASGTRAKGPDGRNRTVVQGSDGSIQHRDGERWPNGGRNVRSVWEIPTQPFSGSALGYGSSYKASPDCPKHGLRAVPGRWRKAADGEPQEQYSHRIDSNDARLALELHYELAATTSRNPARPANSGVQTTEIRVRTSRTCTCTHIVHDHFATYPQELVRRCLLAGCPEWVCGTCGKPRERIVERPPSPFSDTRTPGAHTPTSAAKPSGPKMQAWLDANPPQTTGWSDCGHDNYQPGTVLDPFLGSGTTALVARNHGRRSIGIELNADYCALAARRLSQQSLLAEEVA